MENKKQRKLYHIYNGAIDFYYGLKIETNLKYDDLINGIQKRIDDIYNNYNNSLFLSFQKNVEEAISNIGSENNLKLAKKAPHKPTHIKNNKSNDENIDQKSIIGLTIDPNEKGFNITPTTSVNEHYKCLNNESDHDFNFSRSIYGATYVRSQKRFILPPYEIETNIHENILIDAVLFVFRNYTAILRITFPLNDVDSDPLFTNEIDDYILTINNICGIGQNPREYTFDELKSCYCNLIASIKKVKAVMEIGHITNIILANHSAMFDNVKNIPNAIKEEIYKISVAPVQERKNVSYFDEAKKCFEESANSFNGISYILSSMGKCISLIDTSVVTFVKENYENNMVFTQIINDLRRNVEFTFCILLLKNMNNQYTFYQKSNFDINSNRVQNDYNKDIVFISLLLSDVYGSVREQLDIFENKMRYFLDSKNVYERMTALNSMTEEEKTRRTIELQNTLSIGGLIFTFIFGLPAINETLYLIRKLCSFIKTDIPLLTIENSSFFVWILMILGLSLFLYSKSKSKKHWDKL